MAVSFKWTPEEQREYSLAKLFGYLKEYVHPWHPYYRGLFREHGLDVGRFSSYDDMRRIPLTTRDELSADPNAFILRHGTGVPADDVAELGTGRKLRYAATALTARYMSDPSGEPRSFRERATRAERVEWNPVRRCMSAGTTGPPSMSAYTDYDLKGVIPRIAGMLNMFGLESGMRGLNLLPGHSHFSFLQVLLDGFTVDRGEGVFETRGTAAPPTGKEVSAAGTLPFDMYIAVPSYMACWLRGAAEAIEAGAPAPAPVEYAVLAAEPLSDEFRDSLKDRFEKIGSPGIKIIEGYGANELRAAFFECGEKTGMHLNPEFYFWEVLDPETREPVRWGEPGVLCFSHVGWRGTVLLRYWTGDLIQGGVTWERCAGCGFTMPVLRTPICREVHDFTDIKGCRVPLADLQNAVRRALGVESFQVVITREDDSGSDTSDKVTVHASLSSGAIEEAAINGIRRQVKLDTGISPDEIIIEMPSAIESMLFERTGVKADWVVDRRRSSALP